MRRSILGCGVALLLAAPAAAQAQSSSGAAPRYELISADELAAILQGEGYRARVQMLSDGTPRIDSAAGGTGFSIFTYNCEGEAPVRCEDVEFSAGWDLPQGTSLKTANDWNRENRFAKAWVDEQGDPFLDLDLDLAGGVSQENVLSSLRIWVGQMAEFEDHIGW